MSGFLAGLVQRGASLPGRAGESALTAAPLVPAQPAAPGWLEAPAETGAVDAPAPASAQPTALPGAQAPVAREQAPDRAPEQHVVHVTNVNALPARTIHETQVVIPARAAAVPESPSMGIRSEAPATAAADAMPAPPPPTVRVTPDAMHVDEAGVATDTHAKPGAPPIQIIQQTLVRDDASTPVPRSVPLPASARLSPADRALPETRIEAAPIEFPALRRIEMQAAPVARAPEPPPIQVRIGRVEVRPPAPVAAPPAPTATSAAPALGFAAYRRLRSYRM